MKTWIASFLLFPFLCMTPARADYTSYFANGDENREINFGDGSDGAFADGPAQTGITIAGGPTITIDTDVKSTYQFTSFSASGTVTVTGSRPLVIRVRGDATLSAVLTAEGTAGANAGGTRVGGTGRAGGGNGGNGGVRGVAGASATNGQPSARGGLAGVNTATATEEESGSGGCNGTGAGAGTAFGPAGATCAPQATIAASFETTFTGGAGGGGGGAFAVAGGANDGAGGGAGGGAVHFAVLGNLSISGQIRARGSAGGNEVFGGVETGAPGGGGSGGSIWIQCARTFSGAGTLNVSGGSGGAADGGGFGYTGGVGSPGVIRVDADTVTFAGFTPAAHLTYSVLERPVTTLFELQGGPFCGTLKKDSSGQTPPDAWKLVLLDYLLIFGLGFLATRRRFAISSYRR